MSSNPPIFEIVFNVMKFFVPFLFALCFHEFAHGWVARLRGDRTAEIMGRLTLNPIAHADPIGTVVLPIVAVLTHIPLFGWAKPVPVDERNLKNPRVDMFWIAFAGPLANLLLALVGGGILIALLMMYREEWAAQTEGIVTLVDVSRTFIVVNIFLAVFNMIPLHPLDGAKVLARFLPPQVNMKLEEMQAYTSILLLLIFVTGGSVLIAKPAFWLANLILSGVTKVVFL